MSQSAAQAAPILEMRSVNTHYGAVHALKDVNLAIREGELVCLLGGNASGKSTTLKTLLGMVAPSSGEVVLDGEVVNDRPTSYRVQRGLTMVPENRRLFKRLTVRDNLELGAYLRNDAGEIRDDLEWVFELFPRVKERLNQKAGTLSGGEQQMVAMGRALMCRPRVLLMDEPSMGLAPALVKQNFELIQQIHAAGVTVFVVEQNANMALSIADRGLGAANRSGGARRHRREPPGPRRPASLLPGRVKTERAGPGRRSRLDLRDGVGRALPTGSVAGSNCLRRPPRRNWGAATTPASEPGRREAGFGRGWPVDNRA